MKCPICSKWHPLQEPDVARIPINFAVLDIVRNIVPVQNPEEVKGPQCEACRVKPSTIVCLDCSPGSYYRFCVDCDKSEHERGFAPSARHRRRAEGKIPSSIHVFCSEHPKNEATYFSVELNQFACHECTTNPIWVTRSRDFEPIADAVTKLRGNAQRMIQHSREILDRLSDSKRELIDVVNGLGGAGGEAKSSVSKTFGDIIELIQKRQMQLLKYVDEISEMRTKSIEMQQSAVAEASSNMFGVHSELNQFITKPDSEFLVNYRSIASKMQMLLEQEDKSLYRPVIGKEIPFCIPKDLPNELQVVGAVGGGETPIEVRCNPSTIKGTIMQLQWQLLNEVERVLNFQLEYELLPEFHSLSGNTKFSGPRETFFQQGEIQYQDVPGNKLAIYVDKLCPGFTYRFRIRSANAAGWGMWSSSALGKCDNFPFNITCTKQIHSMRIPYTGLYRITAKGSKATDGKICSGGRGAIIMATFSLSAGDLLLILCGGMSTLQDFNTGGGGGTFVAVNDITEETLLLAAGGGGGTRGYDEQDLDGCDASLEPNGSNGRGVQHGKGGASGAPGEDANSPEFVGPCWGYGGAGYMQSSSTAKSVSQGSFVRADGMDAAKKVGNEDHGSVTVERVSMSPFGSAVLFTRDAASAVTQTSPEPVITAISQSSQPRVLTQISSSSSVSNSTGSNSNMMKQLSSASSASANGSFRADSVSSSVPSYTGSSAFTHADSFNSMSVAVGMDGEEPISRLPNASPTNTTLQAVIEEYATVEYDLPLENVKQQQQQQPPH